MFILHDLWEGILSACAGPTRSGGLDSRMQRVVIQKEQELRQRLSKEEIESLEDYQGKLGDLTNLELEDAFVKGFRLGAKIIFDVFREES